MKAEPPKKKTDRESYNRLIGELLALLKTRDDEIAAQYQEQAKTNHVIGSLCFRLWGVSMPSPGNYELILKRLDEESV